MSTEEQFRDGIPEGSLTKWKDTGNAMYWQIQFADKLHKYGKYFRCNDENDTDIYQKAANYQKEISDKFGNTKNQWRPAGDHIEVKLQNEHIMLCEYEHLDIVQSTVWTARKGKDKKVWYASCKPSVKRNIQKACQFHNMAYPEFTQIDHINRKGLDNRRCNIREGSGRINANNKGKQINNTSGTTGVYFENGKSPRWCAQLIDIDGKKHKKSFSIKVHGEEAFNKACEYREDNNKILHATLGV